MIDIGRSGRGRDSRAGSVVVIHATIQWTNLPLGDESVLQVEETKVGASAWSGGLFGLIVREAPANAEEDQRAKTLHVSVLGVVRVGLLELRVSEIHDEVSERLDLLPIGRSPGEFDFITRVEHAGRLVLHLEELLNPGILVGSGTPVVDFVGFSGLPVGRGGVGGGPEGLGNGAVGKRHQRGSGVVVGDEVGVVVVGGGDIDS